MDVKSSRLPTAIKNKSITRDHIPSDRLVTSGMKPNVSSRGVLTSFENFMDTVRTGTTNHQTKPTKRHASPEFRSTKAHPTMAKRLRRSKSVSDIDAILNQAQKQFQARGRQFAVPFAPPPKGIKVPLAPPKATKLGKLAKPIPTMKAKLPTGAAPKKLATTTASASAAAAAPTTTTKKDDAAKQKATNVKRIPAYDFKSRFQDLSEKHKILKEKHEHLKEQLGEFESLPEQYDECRAKLSNLECEYKAVQEQLQSLEQKSAADEEKIKTLNDELNAKIEECRAVTEAKNRITEENKALKMERDDLKTNYADIENQTKTQAELIEQLTTELKEAGEQLFRANIERKDLHNTIMDLRGNIRVFCRVRPPLDNEGNRMLCSWQYNDETSLEICKYKWL